MNLYYFYALDCVRIVYCGYTQNLSERLRKHIKGTGAQITMRSSPVSILAVSYMSLPNVDTAIEMEAHFAKFIANVFNRETTISYKRYSMDSEPSYRFKLTYPALNDFIVLS